MPLKTASDNLGNMTYLFAGTGTASGTATYIASKPDTGITGWISMYAVEIGAICAIVSASAAIIFGAVGIYIRIKSLKIQEMEMKKAIETSKDD